MRSALVTILMLMLGSGLSAQVRPDFFTEETNPTNSNFEVYSQKGGLNRRASLANLRKYFGAQITVSTVPAATGNAESLRNKVLVVLPDSVTYFVDWNGTSVRLGGGSSGGGELENAYISNDTIFLDTPDSLYTIVLPDELSTELFQDSILVFKTNGVETDRDTIRVPSSGGGGGTITGAGTTGNFAGWSGASALTDAPAFWDTVKVAIQGGRALQFGTWTTAARPATPTPGMVGYNSTNGTMEYYGASEWVTSARSAYSIGLYTATRIPFADANGRLADGAGFTYTSVSGHLFIPARLNIGGTTPTWAISNFTTANSAATPWTNNAAILGLTNTSGDGAYKSIAFGNASQALALISSRQITSTTGDLRFYTIGSFAEPADLYISAGGNVGIQNTAPQRTLHVTGEARITGSAGTATEIAGRNADGDISNVARGYGLTLTSGTLQVDTSSANGLATQSDLGAVFNSLSALYLANSAEISSLNTRTTNLENRLGKIFFSGNSLRHTNHTDTTTVNFAAGAGLAVSQSGGTMTFSRSYSLSHITVSGGTTFVSSGTPERPDQDTPGAVTTSTVGSEFSVSGSTLDFTGPSFSLLRIEGSISFSISDDTDVRLAMYKEGVEIAATRCRITCVAGNYYSVSLPATTISVNTNDTFELRIEPLSGSTTVTLDRYGFLLEKQY